MMTQARTIEAILNEHIAKGELAGAAALVLRRGQPIRETIVGRRDVSRDLPITRDTIFRIASLTKPVMSAAAVTLLDEGLFDLDEPITRVAPELEHLRVLQD